MVRVQYGTSRRLALVSRLTAAAIAVSTAFAVDVAAQGLPPPVPPPVTRVSMTDAVRLTLDRNQTLRGQRLTIEAAKADEITAALKPNPNFSFGADGFAPFNPRLNTWSFLGNAVEYSAGLGYTFERGGKREKRTTVAQATTDVTRKNVFDVERQTRFQAEQAFVNVLLARSSLDLAQQNVKSFSQIVEINRQRVTAGDLAQSEFYRISLQKLQFEQDASAAEVALIQAKAGLRQLMGFDTVAEDFEVDGELAFVPYTLDLEDLKRQAVDSRPDVDAARAGVTQARDAAALEIANRAQDVDGSVSYAHLGPTDTVAVGAGFNLPIHDRNQGNIAKSQVAVRQAVEAELATRYTAITDVVTAYAAFSTNQKIIGLYQNGYLNQARQSVEITRYVYQQGAGTLLDLLDAERTYRDTELAYREALAAYMTSLKQINYAVGKQVIP